MAQSGIVMVNGNPGQQPDPDPTPPAPGSGWSILIDIMRECTRNLLGVFVVMAGFYLLYHFVEITPQVDREKIILLVVGYLGGFMSGALLFYFGAQMRSALAQFQKDSQGK